MSREKAKSEVERITEQLTEALENQFAASHAIQRGGKQIVVPEHMSLSDAAEAIESYEEEMEQTEERELIFEGHPSECLAAVDKGTRKVFGNLIGSSQKVMTFFGEMNVGATTRDIPIGPNETMPVMYGRVKVPGLPVRLTVKVRVNERELLESHVVVDAEYKKKFAPLVDMIRVAVNEELAKNSIFKGKAIDSSFNFIDLDQFPTDKIVYSKTCATELNTHVFGAIRNFQQLKDMGLPIRRSVLLHGHFGTGKTLTALLVAKECVRNGWTFMNVTPGSSIKTAIRFAVKYQPCTIFFEDIDQATPQGRTSDVNDILNSVDGFMSKKSEVMIVMTTNHADRIEQAMTRPGRIDAFIEMGAVDEGVIASMVEAYTPGVAKNIKAHELVEHAKGYTPSFIGEACQRSVLYAIERGKMNGGTVEVTTEDIKDALVGLRPQFEMMTRKLTPEVETIDNLILRHVENKVRDTTRPMAVNIDEIHEAVT